VTDPSGSGVAPAEADASADIVVCFQRCWSCMSDDHCDPPQWHTWADDEDIAHAERTGQPDPRGTMCGCWCAKGETP
jgi:hypothetical protein